MWMDRTCNEGDMGVGKTLNINRNTKPMDSQILNVVFTGV